MENLSNNYRDNLAKDLQEFRKNGKEGKEKAKDYLELSKQTSRYLITKEEHAKERRTEKETKESYLEKESLIEQAYKVVLQAPNIHILISGTGNVLNTPNGATKGQVEVWYDKQSKKLTPLNDAEVSRCLDTTQEGDKFQIRKTSLKKGEVIILDIKIQGSESNVFLKDNRAGCHLTCAIYFDNKDSLRETLGKSLSDKMFDNTQLLTQNTGDLLNTILKKLVPEYYKAVVG